MPKTYVRTFTNGVLVSEEEVDVVILPDMAITPRQVRLALLDANLLDSVESAIDALPPAVRRRYRMAWEYATEVRRGDPMMVAMQSALGLTDAQVDELFWQASTL